MPKSSVRLSVAVRRPVADPYVSVVLCDVTPRLFVQGWSAATS
jgi:hypothetical protein